MKSRKGLRKEMQKQYIIKLRFFAQIFYNTLNINLITPIFFCVQEYTVAFTVHRSPLTINHSPFTINHSPFTVHRSPLTVHNEILLPLLLQLQHFPILAQEEKTALGLLQIMP